MEDIFGNIPQEETTGQGYSEEEQAQDDGEPEGATQTEGTQPEGSHEDVQQEGAQSQSGTQELILGKFRSYDDVANSLAQISGKLGKAIDWNTIETEEQLVSAYKEAEREFGQRSQFVGLERKLQQQEQMIGQLVQALQGLQTQPPQQQYMQQQTTQQDPEQWLANFYKNPIQAINDVVGTQFKQQLMPLTQRIAQQMTPVQRYVQQQQMRDHYVSLVNQTKQKYPDFDDYVQDVSQILEEQPALASLQNGYEIAYQQAKARRIATGQSKWQAKNKVVKKAAGLPSSQGKTQEKQLSPEENLIKDIFGSNEPQGIFG